MKKGKLVKRVISPLLLVISALSFSVGTTYSLFSSINDININISSAKLSIVPSISVSSSLSADAYTVSNNVLYLNSLSSGDTLSITLSLKNESSISSKYRVLISTTDDNSSFTLKDSNDNTLSLSSSSDYKGSYSSLLSVGSNPSDLTYSLIANSDLTNKTLTFKVEVVQGNKDVSEETHKVSIDSNITNGSIVESTKGTSRCLVITPDSNKSLASLSINGTELTNEELKSCLSIDQTTGNYIYDLTSLNKDIEVSATFSDSSTTINDLTIYQASLEDSDHIKLTSSGTYYSTICPLKVKATIDNGYSLDKFQYKDSDNNYKDITTEPVLGSDGYYTLSLKSNETTIKATSKVASITVPTETSQGTITYTGVSEDVTTPYLTISPSTGYSLSSLTIDGKTYSIDELKSDNNLTLDQVNGNYKYYLNDLNSDIEVSATYSDTSSISNDLTIYKLSLTNSSNITLSSKDNYLYFNNSHNKAYISVSDVANLDSLEDGDGNKITTTEEIEGTTYYVIELSSSLNVKVIEKSTTSNKDINDEKVTKINSALTSITYSDKAPSAVLDALIKKDSSYDLYSEDCFLKEEGIDVYPIYDHNLNKVYKSNSSDIPSSKSNLYKIAYSSKRSSDKLIKSNDNFTEFDSSYGIILNSGWYTNSSSSISTNRNVDLGKANLNELRKIEFASGTSSRLNVYCNSTLSTNFANSTLLENSCLHIDNKSYVEHYVYLNNSTAINIFISDNTSCHGSIYLKGGKVITLRNFLQVTHENTTVTTFKNDKTTNSNVVAKFKGDGFKNNITTFTTTWKPSVNTSATCKAIFDNVSYANTFKDNKLSSYNNNYYSVSGSTITFTTPFIEVK